MGNLTVKERIKKVERFLDEEESKLTGKPVKKLAEQPVGTYKSASGLFRGSIDLPPIAPTTQITDQSAIELLKKIVENQEIDRLRYERNNPVEGDEPIYDWAEATINPGFMVQFVYTIPEGHVFYFEYMGITFNANSTYYIWIDGQYQPTLTDSLQDFGDHQQIYSPPKMCYNDVQIWALNSSLVPQTYSVFFRGFNRWYRAIKREIKYESLKKGQKQET